MEKVYKKLPVDVSAVYETFKDTPEVWDLLERWWEDEMKDRICLSPDGVQSFIEFAHKELDDEEYEEVWTGPENLGLKFILIPK